MTLDKRHLFSVFVVQTSKSWLNLDNRSKYSTMEFQYTQRAECSGILYQPLFVADKAVARIPGADSSNTANLNGEKRVFTIFKQLSPAQQLSAELSNFQKVRSRLNISPVHGLECDECNAAR